MADFSLITDHSDSKEIISKLLSGTSPKDVSQWLKIKYPDKEQSHLRLSQKLLKDFNESQYTNVYDQFKKDLAGAKSDKEISSSLLKNKTYRERIQEVAGKEIDVLHILDNLIVIIQQRFEQVFDKIQEKPGEFRGDTVLNNYINTLFMSVEKLEKLRANSPGNVLQQNITMQAFEEYMAIYQAALRETFAEIDPDTAMLFMDKLYNKLNSIKQPTQITQDERLKEATVLQEKIVAITIADNENLDKKDDK